MSKSVFALPEVNFLGHTITCDGIKSSAERVSAIREYRQPTNVKELRRFLGMVNFYRRIILHAAAEQGPLNSYLSGPKQDSKKPILWTSESLRLFELTKARLADAAILAHPILDAELALMVDASD